jgi:hypothetical protein
MSEERIRRLVASRRSTCPLEPRPAGDEFVSREEQTMEAIWPQRNSEDRHVAPEISRSQGDVQTLSGVELDRRIRSGWDDWCELLDDLLSTAGMLPSRDLAGQVVGFFEDEYWRAEDARIEALRRQLAANDVRRCRMTDRSRGI